jgi:ComF family protein
MRVLHRVCDTVLSALYPSRCGLCERIGVAGICSDCVSLFEVPPNRERIVAKPPLDWYAASFLFSSMVHPIHMLKYHRDTSISRALSELLWQHALTLSIPPEMRFVPIPIHWRRHAWRGYNQADNLVSAFPRDRIEFDWIDRIRHTTPQAGQTLEFRENNLKGAFRADPNRVSGQRILLIDDVFTSGTTGMECARALKLAGAREVALLCLTCA